MKTSSSTDVNVSPNYVRRTYMAGQPCLRHAELLQLAL